MYKIYCDNYLLYDGIDEDLSLVNIKLSQEINKTALLYFEMYDSHPNYDKLNRIKSVIKVIDDGKIVFKGRFLDDVVGFYNQRLITCEGSLSFLVDSIVRPYQYSGSVEQLLQNFIADHNSQVDSSKHFLIGDITVSDPNDYIVRINSEYESTLINIQKKFVELLGGYLVIRYEDNNTYIDYLADISSLISQEISFSVNLMDLKQSRKGEDIYTGIIPLGSIIDEEGYDNPDALKERVTIKSVNDNMDYLIDEEGAATYGTIYKTIIWEDVTDPQNLLNKATVELGKSWLLSNSIEISAIDLSNAGVDVSSFEIGNKVKVVSKPHNIEDYYLISKLERNLLNPANDKLTLGKTFKTLTEQNKSENENIKETITVEVSAANKQVEGMIEDTRTDLSTEINSSAEGVISEVRKEYWSKTQQGEYSSSIETKFTQTSEAFNFEFQSLESQLENLENSTDSEFIEIKKYIRFENGDIILGEQGNEITLRIQNDRISFLDNNSEVAYINNKKLYITDGEFLNSLQLGSFVFAPQTNGSLSFSWKGDE